MGSMGGFDAARFLHAYVVLLVVLAATGWTGAIALRLPDGFARTRQLSTVSTMRIAASQADADALSPRPPSVGSVGSVGSGDSAAAAERSIFIFGLGYVGAEVARQLQEEGWRVMGTCTNVNKAVTLRAQGISTHLFDETTNPANAPHTHNTHIGHSEALDDVMSATHVLSTIPPSDALDFDLVLRGYGDALKKSALQGQLRWMGYLSSTGRMLWHGSKTHPKYCLSNIFTYNICVFYTNWAKRATPPPPPQASTASAAGPGLPRASCPAPSTRRPWRASRQKGSGASSGTATDYPSTSSA
jgi:hypothetical protein